jgi:hypothetical protein
VYNFILANLNSKTNETKKERIKEKERKEKK